jgi:8-oxo-dGTP pyrophosphatase MutT (NUDIX family)
MRFEEVERRLEAAALEPLPGPGAQSAMAPRPRPLWVPGVAPASARKAAGLALLYPRGNDTVLLLTVRGAHLAHHRGQVSLPGGAVEAGETVSGAALREAAEEVGLDARDVMVRLHLTPLHIPVSSYVLHPVVATAGAPPDVRPAASEVQRIVEVGLAGLMRGSGIELEVRHRDGRRGAARRSRSSSRSVEASRLAVSMAAKALVAQRMLRGTRRGAAFAVTAEARADGRRRAVSLVVWNQRRLTARPGQPRDEPADNRDGREKHPLSPAQGLSSGSGRPL